MAKKRRPKTKNCDTENCLVHKFWPAIVDAFGSDATYHIDEADGELIVRTGLRVMPDGEVSECPWEYKWTTLTCSKCRRKGHVRLDVLQRRLTTHCPYCTAAKHLTELS